jgi:hypothetical protein
MAPNPAFGTTAIIFNNFNRFGLFVAFCRTISIINSGNYDPGAEDRLRHQCSRGIISCLFFLAIDPCLWTYVPHSRYQDRGQFSRPIAFGSSGLAGCSVKMAGLRPGGLLLPYHRHTAWTSAIA